jgi:hypothetical protein
MSDALRKTLADATVDAFRAQRAHVDRSLAIDRTDWTRQQWIGDARKQMSDLDGSVMDLLNGHVTALLAEVAELTAWTAAHRACGHRFVPRDLYVAACHQRDEARAALAERDPP